MSLEYLGSIYAVSVTYYDRERSKQANLLQSTTMGLVNNEDEDIAFIVLRVS